MSWIRETTRHNRIGVYISDDEDCIFAFIDDKAGRKARYQAYALEPWEARQYALALNGVADAIDPGGSADPPPALQDEEARGKIGV